MNKVLLLFGTRYGTTKEISQKLQEILENNEISTLLINLNDNIVQIPSIQDFDGIIIGTGIRITKWSKNVIKFIENNLDNLKNYKNKFGLFISCGTASNKNSIKKAIDQFITPKLKKYELNPDIYDAFGGIFDLRDSTNLSWIGQKILKIVLKKQEGIRNPEKKIYNFINWNQIHEFGEKFVKIINNS